MSEVDYMKINPMSTSTSVQFSETSDNNEDFYVRYENHRQSVEVPQIIKEFLEEMKIKGYSTNTPAARIIRSFLKYWKNQYHPILTIYQLDISTLTLAIVREYEEHLIQRLSLKEIREPSVYSSLRYIRMMIKYYYDKKAINFRYEIPKSIHVKSKRDNEYIPVEDVMKMFKTINNHSRNKYRDLSILLILFELGCRPIEVSSLSVYDVNLIERTLTIYSMKSGQRILKISSTLKTTLKKYLEQRTTLEVECDALFITCYQEPVRSGTIQRFVNETTIKTFGENRYSAKSFRHTYATNALENGNSFDEVVQSLGHLNWISTMYYLHRSNKRLLKNSLKFNPLLKLEVDKNGNSNKL